MAVRPETRSLLVVGLGAGVTVEEVPASVASIDVVEIEAEIIEANRRVAHLRRRDPLADPRLRLHVNDARGALRLTAQRFDAIVSQPSHPWTAASLLYTREFFSLVRDRLTPNGIFVQWMALDFVDADLLRTLLATVADIFPYVELYQPHPSSVLVVASGAALDVASTAERALAAAPETWAHLGVSSTYDVLATRLLADDGVHAFLSAEHATGKRGVPLNTDARNLFRMRSPVVLRRPLGGAGIERLLAPYEPLPSSSQSVESKDASRDAIYWVRRLIRQRAIDRARRLAELVSEPWARHAALGWVDLAAGRRRQAEASLRRALVLAPGADEAIAALLTMKRSAIASGQPLAVLPKEHSDAAVVVEGWRLIAAGDWKGVRRLETRLADLDPRHPLRGAATRLRVRWRVKSGEQDLAREARELLTPLLAPVPDAQDLVLRARAGVAAGEPKVALAAIEEALDQARGMSVRPAWFGDALEVLRSLPRQSEIEPWRQDLIRSVRGAW